MPGKTCFLGRAFRKGDSFTLVSGGSTTRVKVTAVDFETRALTLDVGADRKVVEPGKALIVPCGGDVVVIHLNKVGSVQGRCILAMPQSVKYVRADGPRVGPKPPASRRRNTG